MAHPRLSPWASVRLPWPCLHGPPYDPGRSDFPSPVLTSAFPSRTSHSGRNAPADSEHAPSRCSSPRSSFLFQGSGDPGSVSGAVPGPPSAQSPFAHPRVLPRMGGCLASPRRALPPLPRSYGLIRQSHPLALPRFVSLERSVFAGCCQPLLGTGPSRRYLCGSFAGCLDPYPGGPRGARARFFPRGIGLPLVRTGSALHELRTATSVRALISGLQSFADVQASGFARPPGRSHRGASECNRAARALTFEPNTGRYLPVHRTC